MKLSFPPSSKRSLRLFPNYILAAIISTIPLPSFAQNNELANLFFTPVPLSQSELITLNSGGLSDIDKQSAVEAIPRMQAEVSAFEQESLEEPEFITLLSTLGVAQQALELHEEALTSFNKATDIAIEIYGENSLQQAPMLEQSIISHLKLNNISEITDIEEFLYSLRAEHYSADSAEMYSAMTNLADWYSSSYFKQGYLSLSPAFIPRVTTLNRRTRGGIDTGGLEGNSSLGAFADGTLRNVSMNDVIDLRLRKLENLYQDYQDNYTSNTTLSIVVDVARRIARLSYHAEQEMDYEREINVYDANYTDSREEAVRNSDQRRDESYDVGKVALEYIVNIIQSAEGVGVQQVAIALLDLADWELAYGRIPPAQSGYQAAYQVLRDEGYDDVSIDTVLAAAVPVAIPRVGNFPATQQTSGSLGLIPNPNYTGYIDVSFSIDDLGNANDITILDSSGVNNLRIQTILESQLDLTKFRPGLRAGDIVAQAPVEYRYYFSY